MKPSRWILLAVILLSALAIGGYLLSDRHAATSLGTGVTRRDISFGGRRFAMVQVDLNNAELQLFWKDRDGSRFGSFETLRSSLERSGRRLVFATNAGIFDPEFRPVGLHVENGRELTPLNLGTGVGNFYMKPNGVLFVDGRGAHVTESTKYPGTTCDIRLATQSGPLLLIDGRINPAFDPNSGNLRIRSGVGVAEPGRVWFVVSLEPVTFYQIASVFQSRLGCRNALYLDGAIPKFYPPVDQSGGAQSDLAGILGVTQRRQP